MKTLHCIRTNSQNQDFRKLVAELDADLAIRDGEDHSFYAQFNTIDTIQYAVVVYQDQIPVGCGAIKYFDKNTFEIKRMYVLPSHRTQGIASFVLDELENWASELGASRCVLETGLKQPEAIKLYEKKGFQKIPNYGQYKNVENSVCFEKILTLKAK